MMDLLVNFVLPIVVVLGSGSGVLAVWLQSRASRAAGVKEQDVAAQKNSGDLALELIRELRTEVRDLKEERALDDARITALERENTALRLALDDFRYAITGAMEMLNDLVAWEQNDFPPPPPHRFTSVLALLARVANRKDLHT